MSDMEVLTHLLAAIGGAAIWRAIDWLAVEVANSRSAYVGTKEKEKADV